MNNNNDNTSSLSTVLSSQFRAKRGRKRKVNVDENEQTYSDTHSNNDTQYNDESSSIDLPLNDLTNSIHTSRHMKRKRR